MDFKKEAIIFMLLALSFVVYMALSSSVFLKPGEITYVLEDASVYASWVRDTPFGSVWANWVTECSSSNTGLERRASGVAYYQQTDNVVSYEVAGPLAECFKDGGIVTIVHKWQVLAFNWLPLWPQTFQYTVDIPTNP